MVEKRRCVRCGAVERSTWGGRCGECGANNWIAIPLSPRQLERAHAEEVARVERQRAPRPRVQQTTGIRPISLVTPDAPTPRAPAVPPGAPEVASRAAPSPRLGDLARAMQASIPSVAEAEEEADANEFVSGAHVDDGIVDDFAGARLNETLGGIWRNAVILIVGEGGHGKSTACAELSVKVAEHWSRPQAAADRERHCPIYWLDADQKDSSLIRRCFSVGKVDHAMDRVKLLKKRPEPLTFDEALACVPDDARILVIDSLEAWAGSLQKQLAILKLLKMHGAWLKLVISGTNKSGLISGLADFKRAVDCLVYAERTGIEPKYEYKLRHDKRRWDECESWRVRNDPTYHAPLVIAAPAPLATTLAGPSGLPPGVSPLNGLPPELTPIGPEPNMDETFIARAAKWTQRELEAYRVRLRTLGCHPDSLAGWNAAVQKERRHGPLRCQGGADGPFCGKPALFRCKIERSGVEWFACDTIHTAHADVTTRLKRSERSEIPASNVEPDEGEDDAEDES